MSTRKEPEPTVVQGEHDLEDHPAVLSGVLRNVGETDRFLDPDEPAHRAPVILKQGEGKRSTTTKDPAQKTAKATTKGDGAGPES